MKFRQKLENIIDWDKSLEEQLDKLAQFDNITDDEIQILASSCYKSTEAGILIEYLGYEKLRAHLPLFLEFLQDINWPAAKGASRMLVKAGRALIPEIQRVFKDVKDDSIWHYWILLNIVQYFDRALILNLKNELLELIKRADKEGASIQALRLLMEQQILSHESVKEHYLYLLDQYKDENCWINELKDEVRI